MAFRGTCALWVVMSMILVSCGGDEPAFTDPGERFEVAPGDEFAIVLESNASTGFAWALETELDESVVRLVTDVFVEPDSDLVGAAGRQELTFEAVDDGSATIELWYVRPFDDPPEPAEQARFEVVVSS